MKYKYLVFISFLIVMLISCKSKKKISLSGEDPIEVSDFIGAFPTLNLPFQLDDTSVVKRDLKDSLWISYKVFTQFVPDSVLGKIYGKEKKIKIFPIGKVGKEQDLLLARAVGSNRWTALVIAFDDNHRFMTAMPVVQPDANPATRQYMTVDPRFTITKFTARKNPNGITTEAKDVYVLNGQAKMFQLIMTVNPDAKVVEMINPIDTFARKNKFSGDYTRDAKNLVSIRDHKKPGRFSFFIHFEKNEGDCTGELKGEANFTSANEAVFKSSGDPCNLHFRFSASAVTIMEENCGSHRGPGCLFEGSYPKKKEPKKPRKKK